MIRRQPGIACRLVLSLLLLPAMFAAAADFTAAFEQANKLYEQGKYTEAVAAYEKLAADGKVSAAIHFNLGNALFKANKLGRAVYHYRLAERLAPRDPDIRANLQFARNRAGSTSPTVSSWSQEQLSRLTLNEWTWLATLPLWACLALLVAGQLRPAWRASLRSYVTAATVLTVVFAVLLALAANQRLSQRHAVVVAEETVVRYGPLDESQSIFTLRDGAEVRVLDEKDGWLQISSGSRPAGWLKRGQVVELPR